MDYQDLDNFLHQRIKNELENRGISRNDFDPGEIQLKKTDQKFKVTYKGLEIDMPVPSQEALDSWWKENGQFFAGAIIALIGVAFGLFIASRNEG